MITPGSPVTVDLPVRRGSTYRTEPVPGIVRAVRHPTVPANVLVVFPDYSEERDGPAGRVHEVFPGTGTYWGWYAAAAIVPVEREGRAA